ARKTRKKTATVGMQPAQTGLLHVIHRHTCAIVACVELLRFSGSADGRCDIWNALAGLSMGDEAAACGRKAVGTCRASVAWAEPRGAAGQGPPSYIPMNTHSAPPGQQNSCPPNCAVWMHT